MRLEVLVGEHRRVGEPATICFSVKVPSKYWFQFRELSTYMQWVNPFVLVPLHSLSCCFPELLTRIQILTLVSDRVCSVQLHRLFTQGLHLTHVGSSSSAWGNILNNISAFRPVAVSAFILMCFWTNSSTSLSQDVNVSVSSVVKELLAAEISVRCRLYEVH